MAIGSGKFNVKHTELDEWKDKLNQKEIIIATSLFREAYKKVEAVVMIDDELMNRLKISAIKKVINLRKM